MGDYGMCYVQYGNGKGTVLFNDVNIFLKTLNAYAVNVDENGDVFVLVADEEDASCLVWTDVTELCLHADTPKSKN